MPPARPDGHQHILLEGGVGAQVVFEIPIQTPPIRLIARIIIPAMAPRAQTSMPRPSRRRNRPRWHIFAPGLRLRLVDQPGVKIGSIAICLPGIASKVKRAETSEYARPLW